MNLLLISQLRDDLDPPLFGGDFAAHLAGKRNPAVRRASLCAWSLLASGLQRLGCTELPAVRFGLQGKPEFTDSPLQFSLAHSGDLAVALLSDALCAVDVERVRSDVSNRLRERCLSVQELQLGLDFFDCWTKKECIGKLDGGGIDARPSRIDTLDARWAGRFHCRRLCDSRGGAYALAALCEGTPEEIRL